MPLVHKDIRLSYRYSLSLLAALLLSQSPAEAAGPGSLARELSTKPIYLRRVPQLSLRLLMSNSA